MQGKQLAWICLNGTKSFSMVLRKYNMLIVSFKLAAMLVRLVVSPVSSPGYHASYLQYRCANSRCKSQQKSQYLPKYQNISLTVQLFKKNGIFLCFVFHCCHRAISVAGRKEKKRFGPDTCTSKHYFLVTDLFFLMVEMSKVLQSFPR